ncbi:hypothetical protein [Streptomyces sp. NPDC127098]|uniref:hypothetical protein n=1 Tax=Streptomyces sp. NPDC127098 TaxID=3347137 RepID=UPI00365C611B
MNEENDVGGARSGVPGRNFAGGSLVANPGHGERGIAHLTGTDLDAVEHGNALCLLPRLT